MNLFRNSYTLLFFLGLLIHLLYLTGLILFAPPQNWNWAHSDTMTYVRPAISFLQDGAFLLGDAPDYRRTIGYPAFLALVLSLARLAELEWRIVAYILQALIFATAYPAILFVGEKLFGLTRKSGKYVQVFLIINGSFLAYVTVIMTDALFATLLVWAVALGILAVDRGKMVWILAYCALTLAAAVTRPILSLFPFAMLAIHAAYAMQTRQWGLPGVKARVLAMCCATLFLVQAPALRNWIHHGVYTSSEHQSIVFFDYLAREVLVWRGLEQEYLETSSRISQLEGAEHLGERIRARKSAAFNCFSRHPAATVSVMLYNFSLNMIEFHWNNSLFYLFRINWYKDYEDGLVLWSPIPYIVGLFFVMCYGVLYLGSALFLVLNRRKHLLLAGLFILALPLLAAATNYQGARFRLWFDVFLILMSASAWAEIAGKIKKAEHNAP